MLILLPPMLQEIPYGAVAGRRAQKEYFKNLLVFAGLDSAELTAISYHLR